MLFTSVTNPCNSAHCTSTRPFSNSGHEGRTGSGKRPAPNRQALHHYLTLRYVPAPDTVDPGRTAKAVQAAIDGTGFIVGGG